MVVAMELFTKLFGNLLAFVYHCFDRIVIHGYLSALSRPEQVVHFFRQIVGVPVVRPSDAAGEPVTVPAGSTLVVRTTGKLNLNVSSSGGVTAANEAMHAPSGTEEHRFKIAAAGTATLRGVGDDLNWSFNAIPDKPPTIALTKDPEQQNRGSLLLSYRIEDDYGAIEAHATFARKDEPAAKDDGPRPLYGPPDFTLVLPQARTKNGLGQTVKDVTDHPWAGADVVMTLTARDEGGNEGKSEPFAFRLPERLFTKPLARALVEQRRNLALDARASAGHHRHRCLRSRALAGLRPALERLFIASTHMAGNEAS
jgi:uncharacterized protein (TIGR02302 family)